MSEWLKIGIIGPKDTATKQLTATMNRANADLIINYYSAVEPSDHPAQCDLLILNDTSHDCHSDYLKSIIEESKIAVAHHCPATSKFNWLSLSKLLYQGVRNKKSGEDFLAFCGLEIQSQFHQLPQMIELIQFSVENRLRFNHYAFPAVEFEKTKGEVKWMSQSFSHVALDGKVEKDFTIHDFIDKDDRTEIDAIISSLKQNDFRMSSTMTLNGNSGTSYTVNIGFKHLYNNRFLAVFCDIPEGATNRNTDTYDAFSEDNAHVEILDSIPGAVFRISRKGEIYTTEFLSRGIEVLTGYTEKELEGDLMKVILKYAFPEDLPLLIHQMEKNIENPDDFQIEYRSIHKSGKVQWIKAKAKYLGKENGRYLWTGILLDISEEKDNEELLHLQKYALEMSAIIAVTDRNGTITYVNSHFENISGYSSSELVGLNFAELDSGVHDRGFFRHMMKTIKSGKVWRDEVCYRSKNQDLYWVDMTILPLVDDFSQRPKKFVAIQTDVSNEVIQKQVDETINESIHLLSCRKPIADCLKKMLDNILPKSSFVLGEIWLSNVDNSRMNLVAQAARYEEDLKTLDKSSFRQVTHGCGFPGEVKNRKEIVHWTSLDQKKEFIRKEEADMLKLESAYGIPMLFNEEVIAVMVFFSRDESLKSNYDKLLLDRIKNQLSPYIKQKKSEQELEAFFRISNDFLSILSTDGFVKKVNPAFLKRFDYSHEEVLRAPFLLLIHKEDRARILSQFKRLIAGERYDILECRVKTRQGEWRWLSWTANSVLEEDLIYIVAKDITDRKLMEQERLIQLKQIEFQNSELRRIAWAQSHLVRLPLSNILGLIDMLNNAMTEDAPNREFVLNKLRENSLKLDQVIREVVNDTESVVQGKNPTTISSGENDILKLRASSL